MTALVNMQFVQTIIDCYMNQTILQPHAFKYRERWFSMKNFQVMNSTRMEMLKALWSQSKY